MKQLLLLTVLLMNLVSKTAAQQNWAAVPCFELKETDGIGVMYVDSAHNELILNSSYSYQICNKTYKAIFAYNGTTFHDLDVGINTHDPNPYLGNIVLNDCVEYNNKTIFTGNIKSVGSGTLNTKYIAVWNGAVWDTFPHPLIASSSNPNATVGFSRLLKHESKLWMFAAYDSSGYFIPKPVVYDGSTFTPIPRIPVNNSSAITEAVMYKNKLVVSGNFYQSPNFDYFRLAQFDGTNWSQVGGGVRGNLSACQNIAVFNDTLYIGGSFPKSAGNAGNYLMKWDGSQLMDAGFSNTFCGYGAIYKLLPYRNRLYAFGTFLCAANQKAFGVAYYENGTWTVPQDSIDMAVSDAVVYKDEIYIGGYFNSINGDTTLRKFVKLVCPDFDAASGCISGLKESSIKPFFKIFPNPAKNKLQIKSEVIQIDRVAILNTLGQELFRLEKPVSQQEIDISGFPSGIYFLSAENNHGRSVIKFVKE